MAVGVVMAVGALAGCEGTGSEATRASTAPSATTQVATTAAPDATVDQPDTTPFSSSSSSSSSSTPPPRSSETILTVPEEGVPGIDSGDPFCRAWSEFAGTFQALAFASVQDSVSAVEREVIAASAVVAAVRTLDDTFPQPIIAEREVFVDDVVGPFARRSARAVDELRAAGVDDDDLARLADAWLRALVDAGVDDPEIAADIPAELVAAVDAAATAFALDVPPIAADPSLITDADAPATLGYLAEQCPDQGILGGNDAIG
jgi:hypothetical protein